MSQADGTTLGADNGLGVAAALAVLDSPADAKLPPVEALFTVVSSLRLLRKCSLHPGQLVRDTAHRQPLQGHSAQTAADVCRVICAGGGDRVRPARKQPPPSILPPPGLDRQRLLHRLLQCSLYLLVVTENLEHDQIVQAVDSAA